MRWRHPLWGEVPSSEFIPIAASTGLAVSISRYALMRLGIDAPNIDRQLGSTVKVSFAPLRHHFVLAAAKRPSALRFCKGAMNLARSYNLTPIAAGVGSEAARQLLIALGCEQGIGEHFARLELKQLL